MLLDMQDRGKTVEEIARAVSTERNRIRLAAYADDPDGLAAVKARNLEKYGHEEGPLPEELYEQYGSWTAVMQKAFGTNSGTDACLGLYDTYYFLYVELGYVPAQIEISIPQTLTCTYMKTAGVKTRRSERKVPRHRRIRNGSRVAVVQSAGSIHVLAMDYPHPSLRMDMV